MATTSWANGVDGNFNTAANWTNGVPIFGDVALITAPGTYTVTSSQGNSVGDLEMAKHASLDIAAGTFDVTVGTATGALAGTVAVDPGTTLELGSDGEDTKFDNTGLLSLIGSLGLTQLVVSGNATLNGKGKITLNSNDQIVSDGNSANLLSHNDISGRGTIGDGNLAFTNEGGAVIDANDPNESLNVDAEDFDNSGVLEASNQGQLVINTYINNGNSGKVEVGADSSMLLAGAIITGGVMSVGKGAMLTAIDDFGNTIDTKGAMTNAGEISTNGGGIEFQNAVKNAATGSFNATGSGFNLLQFDSTVTKGTATIDGAVINFMAAASTNVTFESAGAEYLVLGDPQKFTGTVAGMTTDSEAFIDLENIQFADNPAVSPLSAKGVLTVTDPVTHVVDKIKIVGGGTFTASGATDGSTLISDPPAGSAGNANLLAQAAASFGANSGIAGPGTHSVAEYYRSSDFLAADSHHG